MANFVEWWLAGEIELLGETLPQYHFVHHKSHMTWPGANPGRRGGKPATNRMSYGTAYKVFSWIQSKYFYKMDITCTGKKKGKAIPVTSREGP
jgi:hypothetical protein